MVNESEFVRAAVSATAPEQPLSWELQPHPEDGLNLNFLASTTSRSLPPPTSPSPSRWSVARHALLSYLLSRLTLGFSSSSPLCSPRPPPESLLLLSTSSSSTTPALHRTVSLTARPSKSSSTTASRSRARLVSSVTTSRSSGMVRLGVLPSVCPAAQPASFQVTLRLP